MGKIGVVLIIAGAVCTFPGLESPKVQQSVGKATQRSVASNTAASGERLFGSSGQQRRGGQESGVNQAAEGLASASHVSDYLRFTQRLFHKRNDGDVMAFRSHAHSTVAIAAAWHDVCLTFERPPRRENNLEWAPREPIRSAKLQRFLGFVEGRLRIQLPAEWEQTLTRARVTSRHGLGWRSFDHWPLRKTRSGYLTADRLEAADRGAFLVVGRGEDRANVPKSLWAEESKCSVATHSIVVGLNKRYCVCGMLPHDGGSFELHCVRRRDGTVCWTAEVMGTMYGASSGPVGEKDRAAVSLTSDRVVVYGVGPHGAHLQVFAIETGAALCRFSTSATF